MTSSSFVMRSEAGLEQDAHRHVFVLAPTGPDAGLEHQPADAKSV